MRILVRLIIFSTFSESNFSSRCWQLFYQQLPCSLSVLENATQFKGTFSSIRTDLFKALIIFTLGLITD
jgi:hypothetical protein